MRTRFLAWQTHEGGSAQVLAAQQAAGAGEFNLSGMPDDGGGTIKVPSPEGSGLHVWQGELAQGNWVGEWRRATRRDLEDFGVPLSEPTGSKGFCCAMRAKYLLKLGAVDVTLPDPPDLMDFVVGWEENRAIVSIRFCPFCGSSVNGQEVRTA